MRSLGVVVLREDVNIFDTALERSEGMAGLISKHLGLF